MLDYGAANGIVELGFKSIYKKVKTKVKKTSNKKLKSAIIKWSIVNPE